MGSDDVLAQADPAIDPISIHAPRMGSDPDTTTPAAVHDTISIHAPRMGSDVVGGQKPFWSLRFQSTLPGWGATFRAFLFGLWG